MDNSPTERQLSERITFLQRCGTILQQSRGIKVRICQTGPFSISMILSCPPMTILNDRSKDILLDLLDASDEIALQSEDRQILLILDFDPRFMNI